MTEVVLIHFERLEVGRWFLCLAPVNQWAWVPIYQLIEQEPNGPLSAEPQAKETTEQEGASNDRPTATTVSL